MKQTMQTKTGGTLSSTTFRRKAGAGFTLIELLVTITIIGVLAALITANLSDARARARDSRIKQDLTQLKTALRLYYNDYQKYPDRCGLLTTTNIKGCGPLGTTCCPVAGCPEFAAGGSSGCDTVYMNKLPAGLDRTVHYYSDNNDQFCLVTNLENPSDPDIANSFTTCNPVCNPLIGGDLVNPNFAVCAD